MQNALYTLPCFSKVESISVINAGLSQKCYKVYADNKFYFAKTVSGNAEAKMAVPADTAGFSPSVFYHDQQWLVTDFIDAENLALNISNTKGKINHAIRLMVQCHQLNYQPAKLSAQTITNELINKPHFSALKKTELQQYAELVLAPLNNSKNLVCCHGDLNFSNVLIDQQKHTWLVDFECACLAPAEFDLAMFIAVNNISENKISGIITQYQHHFFAAKIDHKLLYAYLTFSYFINSLWFTNSYNKRHEIALLKLHQQQWKKFTLSVRQ
ncbi:MAG: phosphotransferase [Colwellia sp.]|nr:phosphotransferase [Colwellia sp.]